MKKLTLVVLAALVLTGCSDFETTLFEEVKNSCEARGGTITSFSFGRIYDPITTKVPLGTIASVQCDLSKDK